MAHHPYTESVRKMAAGNWGREQPSEEEAIHKLDVPAAALLELVRRLNQVCDALARDNRPEYRPRTPVERPEDVKPFPGAEVGDLLYSCSELGQPVDSWVVVGVAEDGCVLVLDCDPDAASRAQWAADWMYPTLAEALRSEAESDAAYHAPRLALANRVLAAVAAGGDLAEFAAGVDVDGAMEAEAES